VILMAYLPVLFSALCWCHRNVYQGNKMKFHLASLALLAALSGSMSSQAYASPPTLASGSASISAEGDTLTISTDSFLLEWSSFSVAAGQTVDFIQPSGNYGVSNLLQGGATLEVFGVLRSNRPLTLFADTIYVAPGGVIDVPGLSLVASQSVNMSGLLRGSGVLTIEAPSLFVKGPLVSDGVVLQAGDYQGSGRLTLGSNGGSFSALTVTMANFDLPIIAFDMADPVVVISSAVPEPTEAAMLAAGLLTLLGLSRKGAGEAPARTAWIGLNYWVIFPVDRSIVAPRGRLRY